MGLLHFAFALTPQMIEREAVKAELREDTVSIVFGLLYFAIGCGALMLFRLRRRSADRALLWFGVWCVLQGARTLFSTHVWPFLTEPVPHVFWTYVRNAITYVINVPVVLFLCNLFVEPRIVFRWLVWLFSIFGIAGLIADQVWRSPGVLSIPNNVLVLASVGFWILLLRKRENAQLFRPARLGLFLVILAVLLNNGLGLFSMYMPFDPEPPAMAVLFGGFGVVLAKRAFEDRERLSALDKELEIARGIQNSILPRQMPSMNAVSVSARYLPMTAVAGDFYEFLIPDQRRLGILIADVSGHGVPAALIASMVKVAIAGQLAHADDPAKVLAGMNGTLCGKLQGQFVTAAYLFLDFENNLLRYSAAGHPALLWRDALNGTVVELVENGLILGMLPIAQYRFIERRFTPGDRFLMYTDGLLEAANPAGEFYGEERLRGALKAAPRETEGAADAILHGLSEWSGQRGQAQEDDLTVIVVDTV